jgi:hypothetical protein
MTRIIRTHKPVWPSTSMTGSQGEDNMRRKTLMAGLCALLVIAGLTACGKRGDPYRPAEIPTQQTSS